MERIVFAHLSDIHFTRASGVSVHDLDNNVRNELVLDATKVANHIGPVTGVLVTGDVAFSGNKIEYDNAASWLRDFCKAIRCPSENVWVVPGNHDVDRAKTKQKFTRTFHEKLRERDANVDLELREILSDKQSAAALLEPLTEYNTFAGLFGCSLTAEKHFWERDLKLACGAIVRLRGVTSALVSNEDDARTRIVLGEAQASVKRAPGVLHVMLCHHPPDWLRDIDAVENHLKSKVHVQLFGHKHSQRLDEINGMARLSSGAMHPERTEVEWLPTYNFLEISRRDHDRIVLRVFQRQWNTPGTNFVPWRDPENGNEHREFLWSGFPIVAQAEAKGAVCDESSGAVVVEPSRAPIVGTRATEEMNAVTHPSRERRLTYRFLTLPFRHQISIANSLDILNDADGALSDQTLFRLLFRRAAERGLLQQLWDETEKRHDDPADFNPFETPR